MHRDACFLDRSSSELFVRLGPGDFGGPAGRSCCLRALRVAGLVAASVWVGCAGCGRDVAGGEGAAEALPHRAAVVGRAAGVEEPGYGVTGIAVGEGGVWVGGWDRRGGLVLRLDARSGDLVATVRLPHRGGDVAVGPGAVWTARVVCVGPHPDDPTCA
jgi:hypothetical protein